MGKVTKIDWCDSTWNPVTGCLHGCEYCYARGIAERFSGRIKEEIEPEDEGLTFPLDSPERFPVLDEPMRCSSTYAFMRMAGVNAGRKLPYPFGFTPTFHRYKLDEPKRWKKPRTIFVCSMADLFGEWVPDEWIIEVLNACREAPQHRYLFLTKNPTRYDRLEDVGIITPEDENIWLGSTVTDVTKDLAHYANKQHTFFSCEPMLSPWPEASEPNRLSLTLGLLPEWVIFGAETGKRRGKIIPEKAWVDNAVQMCRNMGAAVFMKESLREIMGDDFIQEFPWEESQKEAE